MMNYVIVSKEEAKRMIDEAPGSTVVICATNDTLHIHFEKERRSKKYGKFLVESSKKTLYQNNDFFGVISLPNINTEDGVQTKNILFPQLE